MKAELGYRYGKPNSLGIFAETDEEEKFLEEMHDVKPRITITYLIEKPKKKSGGKRGNGK